MSERDGRRNDRWKQAILGRQPQHMMKTENMSGNLAQLAKAQISMKISSCPEMNT